MKLNGRNAARFAPYHLARETNAIPSIHVVIIRVEFVRLKLKINVLNVDVRSHPK